MKFENGMRVVYKNIGVCTVEDIETKSFDEVNDKQYYKLKPISNNFTTYYYVPVDKSGEQIRNLFTKAEIDDILKNTKDKDEIWINNSRERRMEFNKILKSDNYNQIIRMAKSLYHQKQEKQKQHKHLSSSDEMILNSAETLIFQEFSEVLGIQQNDVREYIISKVEQ
ncbi:MAG: hypothetical protein K2G63_00170 [Oscillospiraceae bacterium]|nr:hypothetical protein [Oscillospiraceae bacterium]